MGHREKSDDHDQIQLLLAEHYNTGEEMEEPEVINCRQNQVKEDNSMLPEPERGTNMYIIGCLLSVTASCLRAFSMAGSQMLDNVVGEFQLNVGRFGSMFGFLMPYFIYRRPVILISKKSIIPVIVLSLVTFGCNIFIYASTVYIPVGTANTLINISFLTIILAVTVVNVCLGGVMWNFTSLLFDVISVLITCIGVVFVIQPEIFFSNVAYFKAKQAGNYTSFCNPHRFDDKLAAHYVHNRSVLESTTQINADTLVELYKHESWKGYVHATLAGFFNALRVICNKRLLRHEGIYPVMFWTALIATMTSLVVTIIFETFSFPDSTICTLIVFGHASATGLQTVLLVAGMKFVPSTDLTLIYSFTVALLFAFQFTFLKEASPAPNNAVAIVAAVSVSCISIGKPILESFNVRYGAKRK